MAKATGAATVLYESPPWAHLGELRPRLYLEAPDSQDIEINQDVSGEAV